MTGSHGVKRYEPRFDMLNEGWFMLEVDGDAVEAYGKTYVESVDYARLAALMPRVWTAETIKDAPEGERHRYHMLWKDGHGAGNPNLWDENYSLSTVVRLFGEGHLLAAYGPIITTVLPNPATLTPTKD